MRERRASGEPFDLFRQGFAKIQLKRDNKAALHASVRDGSWEPSRRMTKEEAITILVQDIADYDKILAGLRQRNDP
jgi:hypothetical protein